MAMQQNNSSSRNNRHAHRRPENLPRTGQKQIGSVSSSNANTVGVTYGRAVKQQQGRGIDREGRIPGQTNAPKSERVSAQSSSIRMNGGQFTYGVGRQTSSGGKMGASHSSAPKPVRRPQQIEHVHSEKALSPVQPQTGLAAWNQRRLQRAKIREEAKEEKWQKDIVRVRGGVDKIMLGLILTLVCLGTIMVFSASYPSALNDGLDMFYYGKRQLVLVAIGLVVMAIAAMVPYTWYKVWGAFVFYGVSIILLILVLVIGVAEGEAKRWIYLGMFTVQPSEVAKFSLVLMLAWYLDKFKPQIDARLDRKHTIQYNVLVPGIFIGTACVLILLEKHLSGTLITGILGVAVMLVGGCHFGWTMLFLGTAGIGAGTLFVILNPYALKRLTTFVDEDANLLAEAYQTSQGLYAIGSGGLFGVGLGQSRQKYSYVSEAHTDFIFTIWCEEMGFIGAIALVLLFAVFVLRGYYIASKAPDTFSSLVAYGISTHVGLQALMNMCVVTDIIPNTGVPLPFFTYGGSFLIVLLGEMGILLSISKQYYMKRHELEEQQRRVQLGLE